MAFLQRGWGGGTAPLMDFSNPTGLRLLLVIAVLNIYKPRGLTRDGWRKEQEAKASRAALARSA